MEQQNKQRGGRRPGAGRPPKSLTERQLFAGKVAVRLGPTTAFLAQRLLLCDWPGVTNIESLIAYALRRLDEQEATGRRYEDDSLHQDQ